MPGSGLIERLLITVPPYKPTALLDQALYLQSTYGDEVGDWLARSCERRLHAWSNVAKQTLKAGIHVLGTEPGWNCHGHHIGDAELARKRNDLFDAFFHRANHPGLRNTLARL